MRRSIVDRAARLCCGAATFDTFAAITFVLAALVATRVVAGAQSAAPASQSAAPVSRQQSLLADALAKIEKNELAGVRPMLDESLALAGDAGDVAAEAGAERGLGLLLQAEKDFIAARAHFDRALALYESIHNVRGMAQTHASLGFLSWATAHWSDVRRFYATAAQELGSLGDRIGQAGALRSETFDQEMTVTEEIAVLSQALDLVRSTGDRNTEGLILHQWGDALTTSGQYGPAFEKLESAFALLTAAGTPLDQSYVATSLGRAYRLHGQPERALEYYRKALAAQERIGNQRAMAQSLGAIAIANSALGNRREAIAAATRGLAVARQSGFPGMVVTLTNTLAAAEFEDGRPQDAIRDIEPVLRDTSDAVLAGGDGSYLRMNFARALAAVGRLDDALRESDRAVADEDGRDRLLPRARAHEVRAPIRLARGDAAGAIADANLALDLFEQMRRTLPPRDFFRQAYLDGDSNVYSVAIDVGDRTGHAGDALVAAEKGRARGFQDLLASREVTSAEAASAAGDALVSSATTEAPTLDEMKAVVARLNSPLIAYWVAPKKTYAWVVNVDGTVSMTAVPITATALEALVRAAFVNPEADHRTARPRELRQLYDLLIAPIRGAIHGSNNRLTIIPYGPLFRASFAAFVDERGRYLVEDFEVHYAPAIGVLRFTEMQRRGRGLSHALLVADPESAGAAAGEKLEPLPGSRKEVADAARVLGAGARVLVGRDATERDVRRLLAGQDLLHFATHGIVNDREPLASYLVLGATGSDAGGDGRLTASEVYGLSLTADLVVLSACKSAGGKVTGDGIIGLSRGFFYAGVPSVIATLWDLADDPADYLMRRFYVAVRGGATKAAALRTAQLDLIRALRAGRITVTTPFGPTTLKERPALWASFVLLGEP